MSEIQTRAHKNRGAALAGLTDVVEKYKLVCADCSDLPVIGAIYSTGDGPRVEVLRQVIWNDPGTNVSGAPTWMWIVLTLDQIERDFLPLACFCHEQHGTSWSGLLGHVRARPRRTAVRIRRDGVVTV